MPSRMAHFILRAAYVENFARLGSKVRATSRRAG
jgi:hypothetical protein